jgi:hypothetical protein
VFTIQDADLLNEGVINGTGTIHFTGTNASALNSSGLLTAPAKLLNKQLYLTGTSNTGSIELTGGSHLKLDFFDLNPGAATITGDASNYIITNDIGRVNQFLAGTGITYHIGTNNSSYTPVTVTNTGNPDYFGVRVAQGVTDTASISSGNVDRTWFIGDSLQVITGLALKMQWNESDEQPGFDRNGSYVSHFSACQAIVNCDEGYYDIVPAAAAAGTGPYSMLRNSISHLKSPAFIISSRPFVYTFTGNGDWNEAVNWTPGIVPVSVITPAMEVLIDPILAGQCIHNGDITIQPGGKLTVKDGKAMTVTGNIVVE